MSLIFRSDLKRSVGMIDYWLFLNFSLKLKKILVETACSQLLCSVTYHTLTDTQEEKYSLVTPNSVLELGWSASQGQSPDFSIQLSALFLVWRQVKFLKPMSQSLISSQNCVLETIQKLSDYVS